MKKYDMTEDGKMKGMVKKESAPAEGVSLTLPVADYPALGDVAEGDTVEGNLSARVVSSDGTNVTLAVDSFEASANSNKADREMEKMMRQPEEGGFKKRGMETSQEDEY